MNDEGQPIAFIEFAGVPMRPVYEDFLGYYVVDDFGQRIAGVWFIPRQEPSGDRR